MSEEYTAVNFMGLLRGYKIGDGRVTLNIEIKEEYSEALEESLEWCRKNTESQNTGNRIIISVGESDSR